MKRCVDCDAIVVKYGVEILDEIFTDPEYCLRCFLAMAKREMAKYG